MKKILISIFFIFTVIIVNAQLRPQGLPSPNGNGYSKVGFSQMDSGMIMNPRDTFSAKYPTLIRWSGDNTFWQTLGNGARWFPLASGSLRAIYAGFGLTKINDSTLRADTSINGVATWALLKKKIDSVAALTPNFTASLPLRYSSGNISVDTGRNSGYLVTGGTLNKVRDSVTQLIPNVSGYKLISDTLFNGGYTTRNTTKKIADSLAALISAGGFGTVLSVSTTDGVGIVSSVSSPTANPNISIRVDTNSIATRLRVQKGIDSLGVLITTGDAAKLNISDTAAMLTPNYRRTITKITNSDLVNSTISGTALGSNLPALTFGTYLQSGALSYNGTTANTITTNATSSNLGTTLVARDVNGDFSARNISASLVGNASSASTINITNDNSTNATMYPIWSSATSGTNSPKVSSSKITFNPNTGVLTSNFAGALTGNASSASVLQTPRTINGVAFDGSANISISASVDSSLSAGYGITGSPFNGSLGRTWVVDTTKIIPYTDTLASWGIASKAFVRSLASDWYTVTDSTKSYKPIVWIDSVWIWRGRQYATQNVAVGYRTLPNNIYTPNLFSPYAGGDMNVALGYKALEENTDGRRNTAVGTTALNKTTTGNYNTAIGSVSMFNNTTGVGNVGLGVQTLQYNTTGNYNTALGTSALLYNETADYNVAIGRQSMINNTTGANNTVGGSLSMFTNTTGANNTVWGYGAGYSSTTGSYNSIYGSTTGYDITTGSNNTFIGRNTGRGITTGNGNTILGGQVTGLSSTLENYIIIADGVGNRRINIPASGNLLLGTTTDAGDAILQANGNVRAVGGYFVGTNVTMEGSGHYVDYRGTNYARYSSSDGATQRGYIQHNGTDLTFNNDIAGVFTFNKGVTITGNATATSFLKTGSNNNELLAGGGGVVTAGSNISISGGVISATGLSSGTVTSVATDATMQGGTITTSGTLKVDTVVMATRLRVQKGIDSLGQIVATKGIGSVTSVATNTGSGITGGTITGSGTIAADTSILSTKANVTALLLGKGVGSVTSVATNTGSGITGGTITSTGTISADTSVLSTKANVTASLLGKVSSVSGTTNRVTSTGGATPVIDISSSYIGQSSITTVGTLSSGSIPYSLLSGTVPTWNQNTTGSAALNLLLTGGNLTGALTGTSATFTTGSSNTQLTVNGTGSIKSGINFASGGTTYGQIYFDNNAPYSMSVLQQYSTGSLILGTNNTANLTIANGGAATFSSTITAAANTYSSGGYDMVVRNATSGTLEKVAVSTGSYALKTSNYTAVAGDEYINVTGNTTITLPTAVGITGKRYTITNVGSVSETTTVNTTSSQSFINYDGGAVTFNLSQNKSVTVVSNGANWFVIGGFNGATI